MQTPVPVYGSDAGAQCLYNIRDLNCPTRDNMSLDEGHYHADFTLCNIIDPTLFGEKSTNSQTAFTCLQWNSPTLFEDIS